MNSKERCLAVIEGKPVDRPPVFPLLMFLAADRLGVSYRQYATDGRILAESQLKAYQTFGLDAITACSDAFRLAADLGGEMVFPEERPPYLAHPLVTSTADLARLKRPQVARPGSRTADRARAVSEMERAVGNQCLVLGWVDMPFAEACSLCGVSEFMLLLVDQPLLAHAVLEFITPIVIDFALLQLNAGAPMIGAGDAAASLISARQYREFALPYEQRVCAAVHKASGLIKLHICGKTTHLLDDMVQSDADLFNVDHLVPLEEARRVYSGAARAYKGNLNPVTDMLYANPETCQQRALECLRIARGSSYMLSPGCEVPAAVTDEVLRAFCEAVMKL